MKDKWLTLMEYSNKHKVSISTLRRRIKAEDIGYQLSDGKYFILDEALPTQSAASGSEKAIAPPTRVIASQSQEPSVQPSSHKVCETSEKLLQEVKRAYALILQEKEEQILQLREEVSDLKTLVRVLENEVNRLTAPAPSKSSLSSSKTTSEFDIGLDLETF